MCGLAGFVDGRDRGAPPAVLAGAMAETLRHRGPDDEGVWCDPDAGFAVGFRRLAILDLSPAGHQPMRSADGRWVIAFNGEVYNHAELRARLDGETAVAWRGHSDTEVLLEAIARWGLDEALASTEAMFALALWDRATRTLTLARDRAGEKPLYWGRQNGAFLFGSELKALRRHPAFAGTIDRAALGAYLTHGWVPGPRTIYEGISKLEPGHLLELRDGRERTRCWWSTAERMERAAADPFAGDEVEASEELERLLSRAVELRRVADVPVGAFLSGGIDSSAVVAALQRPGAAPLRTITIGFDDPRFDEAPFAEAVAARLGTEHTAIRMDGAQALEVIPRLAEIYDEPYGDVSQLPTVLLCRAAREHVTVALAGDGGDELFGGYPRYESIPAAWRRRPPGFLRDISAGFARRLPVAAIDGGLGAISGLVGLRKRHAPAARWRRKLETIAAESPVGLTLLHHSRWREGPPLVEPAPGASLLNAPPTVPRLCEAARLAMATDFVTYLPDDLLVKVDRASMASSLEVRLPFLDSSVMDFAWRLPTAMKLGHGQSKRVLRRLLERRLPRELIDRPKRGFEPPVGTWLSGPLRDWAEDLLDETRLRRQGLLDPARVRKAWIEHRDGRRARAIELWGVLMFQSWLEATASGA